MNFVNHPALSTIFACAYHIVGSCEAAYITRTSRPLIHDYQLTWLTKGWRKVSGNPHSETYRQYGTLNEYWWDFCFTQSVSIQDLNHSVKNKQPKVWCDCWPRGCAACFSSSVLTWQELRKTLLSEFPTRVFLGVVRSLSAQIRTKGLPIIIPSMFPHVTRRKEATTEVTDKTGYCGNLVQFITH